MKTKSLAISLAAIAVVAGCANPKPRTPTKPASQPSSTQPSSTQRTASGPVTPASLLARVRPSLVVVQYTYDGEQGRRELEGAGIIVREDGLVAIASGLFPPQIPEAQMIRFKVIVPPGVEGVDEVEYDATYLGRDERADLSYVRIDPKPGKTWPALTPVDRKLEVGETLYSVGLLTDDSGYAAYVQRTTISALLRGPVPLVLTAGGLTAVGSPVFDAEGRFVAVVPQQENQTPFLNLRGDNDANALLNPPIFVVANDYLMPSLNDPPTAPGTRKMPWLGIVQMTGLKKEVAEIYGLKGEPAIQVGDVIPGAPADKAGLKEADVITRVNGKALERGDTPEELPMILARQLSRLNVGDDVTLTILRGRNASPQDVNVKLAERPVIASAAERYYAEDLGFTVRDLVFQDRYSLRVAEDFGGVATVFIRPQGSTDAAGLKRGDVITKVNQIDVTDVKSFKDAYETFRRVSPKEAVVFEVLRGSDTQIIRVQPPQ
jgi:S1-C subfamily serine protease